MTNTGPIEDRKQLWKMHHASADFSTVKATCRYLRKGNFKDDDPIYYSLVVAIYTMYGRPFTKSIGAGKLNESIIPVKHRALHKQLLSHRHTVFAHSDAINAPAAFGNINQVRFFVQANRQIQPGVVQWPSDEEVLDRIIILCEILISKAKYWIRKIQDKYFPNLHVQKGEYLIDLDPQSPKFLIPSKTLASQGLAPLAMRSGYLPKSCI